MRNILLNLINGFIIILLLVGITWAQDNVSLSVSFTIPAIPGVNVPMEKEAGEINIQDEKEEKMIAGIQEDAKEIIITEENNASVIVQTIYSR